MLGLLHEIEVFHHKVCDQGFHPDRTYKLGAGVLAGFNTNTPSVIVVLSTTTKHPVLLKFLFYLSACIYTLMWRIPGADCVWVLFCYLPVVTIYGV